MFKVRSIRVAAVSNAFTIVALISMATTFAWGQTGTASISGTVLDATGAAVPGASVDIANASIGFDRKLETNGAGIFAAPALQPASGYTVTVEKPGFSKYEVKQFDLVVGAAIALNIPLSVSSAGTAVDVTAEAPVVEAGKTDVSQVVDNRQIMDLPINGRRVDSFVAMMPGVAPDAAFGLLTFRGNSGGNTFLTDGVDTTNNFYDENAGRTRTYNISQDAVQEFQVVTSNFLPEYGRASGGVVNTITKSGTNSTHGSLFWFFRNRTLNATDPTSNGINPPDWRHQAGATIGGPIKKDKLFYFFSGELQRHNAPILSSNITSTLFDKNGNPLPAATDPLTGCGGTQNPSNTGVTGVFAPAASAAQCTAAINFLETRVKPQIIDRTADVNLLFGKIDYVINDRNRFNAEMNYLDFRSPNGIQTQAVLTNGGGIGNNGNTNVFDRTVKSGLTTIISATALNEIKFGMFKDRQYDPVASDLEPVTGPASYTISTGSLSNIGMSTSYPRLHPSELRFQIADTFSYIINKHSLKFGIDWAHTEDYDYSRSNQFGTWTYPNLNAFALDFSNPAGGTQWSSYSQKFGNPLWDGAIQDFAFFAQDEYHVTPKLTISPGFRVEHTSLPQPSAPVALGALNIPNDWPQTGKLNYQPTNIAPRIGVAYAFDQKTVIRAGYGMFYNRYITQIIDGLAEANGSYQPSYTLQANVPAQLAVGPVFPTPLTAVPNVTGSAALAFSTQDFRNAYSEQLQVSVQREILHNTSFTASYVWSRGLHIVSGYNANLSAPSASYTYAILNTADVNNATAANQVGAFSTPLYTRSNLINPAYGAVMAVSSNLNSYYNGLLLQVVRRYTNWFSLDGNYSWAHSIDYNIGGAAGNFPVNNGVLFAPSQPISYANNDFRDERGSSATDQRHRLVINAILNPRFTRGNNWVERNIINGWQLAVASTFASGFPITSTIGGVSSSSLPTVPGGLFSTSSINGLGGSTRVPFQPISNFYTPPIYRTDARLVKNFSVTERVKVQLGIEAQNVFNHLIVSGAAPLNAQEYTLVKVPGTQGAPSASLFAGQSVLVPFANYKQLLQTLLPFGESSARRAQVSVRILF